MFKSLSIHASYRQSATHHQGKVTDSISLHNGSLAFVKSFNSFFFLGFWDRRKKTNTSLAREVRLSKVGISH